MCPTSRSDRWCARRSRRTRTVPIDVHLMVKPVDRIVPDFAKAGASIISFHPEASEHVDRTIGLIHDHGCKAGLVFNPATPLDWLDHVLDKLDLVLIMSVNPGFGGQSFIPDALVETRRARKRIDAARERTGREIRLEVDGGVKVDNIGAIARGGRRHLRRRHRRSSARGDYKASDRGDARSGRCRMLRMTLAPSLAYNEPATTLSTLSACNDPAPGDLARAGRPGAGGAAPEPRAPGVARLPKRRPESDAPVERSVEG